MSKGIVRYTYGDDGELMRVMPSGQVSFSDSLSEAIRDMHELEAAGYQVFIEDKPLIPKTGVLGWLHRTLDRLEAFTRRKRNG